MLLSKDDAAYFLHHYKQTLNKLSKHNLKTHNDFIDARNNLFESKNKLRFSPVDADNDFRNALSKAKIGIFIFLKRARNGFLFKEDKTGDIFLVIGITDYLDEILENFSIVRTSIMPFRNKLITDGLFEFEAIFGPSIIKDLKEEIKLKRKNGQIFTKI